MKFPEKYKAEYIGDCGESYFIENCGLQRIPIFCDECDVTHYFYIKHIIHLSWEWDRVESSLDDEDFFGDAHEQS